MNHQLQTLAQANAQTGGMYAVPLANAVEQKAQMEAQTAQGFGGYYASTEATTAGEVDLDGDGIPTFPPTRRLPRPLRGRNGSAGRSDPGEPGSQDMAGQLASMLPSMIPTVLGRLGTTGRRDVIGDEGAGIADSGRNAGDGCGYSRAIGVDATRARRHRYRGPGLRRCAPGRHDGFWRRRGGVATSPASGGAPSTPPVMPPPAPTPPRQPCPPVDRCLRR